MANIIEVIINGKDNLSQAVQGVNQQLQQMGESVRNFGAELSLISAPLALALGQGVRAASDFDALFTQISARTGIVGAELSQLQDLALQWGADTVFSAQQAGDAFLQLLTAGMSTSDAIATMPSILSATAAGNMELGRAADWVSNVMASMGLQTTDTAALIDAVARASAASPAEMEELLEAMAGVGGMAEGAGMNFEDLSALLAIFAQAGIRGSEAGTQLRSMLVAMNAETDKSEGAWKALGTSLYDSDGNARRFADVLEEMRVGLSQMDDQTRNSTIKALAGSYGLVGFNALLASDGIDEMLNTMSEQAAAQDVAQQMMGSFKMSVDSLLGSIQALQIKALTPFMNRTLKPLIQRLIEVVNGVTQWVSANPELTDQIVKIIAGIAALGPALLGAGQVIKLVGVLFGALTSPLGLVVAALSGLKLAFDNNFLGISDLLEPIFQQVIGGVETLMGVFGNLGNLISTQGIGGAIDSVLNAFAQMFGLVDSESFYAPLRGLGDGIIDIFTQVMGAIVPLFEDFVTFMAGLWAMVAPALQQLGAWFLQDVLPAIGDLLSQRLLPLLGEVFGFLGRVWDIVSPALQQVAGWFLQEGLPAIQTFISTSVLPTLDAFFGFIGQVWQQVAPALERLLAWFVQEGLPAIGTKISEVWQTLFVPFINLLQDLWAMVEPALSSLFNWFVSTGLPAIRTFLLGFWNNVLAPVIDVLAGIWDTVSAALGLLVEWFTVKGLPAIRDILKGFWDNVLTPVINVLKGIWDAVRPGIEAFASGIRQFLQPVMDFIHGIRDAIADLKRLLSQEVLNDARVQSMGYGDPRAGGTIMGFGGGGAFGGGRARGGYVAGGTPYMVGERGPELFVPSSSGTIVPNHAMGGQTVINVNVTPEVLQTAPQAQSNGSLFGEQIRLRLREAG